MTGEWVIVARVALAAGLGALLGAERDWHGKPAGLRTNLIIAIGSCAFAILSAEGFAWAGGQRDPTRIASIVVQGIGFICAGVLLKSDSHVYGLTTAATVWLVAAIGLACGAGMYFLAIFITLFSLGALVALEPLSARLQEIGEGRRKRIAQERGEPAPVVKKE